MQAWTDERLDDFASRVERDFARVDARFDRVDGRFDRVEREIRDLRVELTDRMDARFDAVDARFDHLYRLLIRGMAGGFVTVLVAVVLNRLV
jgi:chromosome segregation ATPase